MDAQRQSAMPRDAKPLSRPIARLMCRRIVATRNADRREPPREAWTVPAFIANAQMRRARGEAR
ncbi:hypothetical protein [Pararhodospirillum photometricum]|uniref:hypothetical protein n=1 Tax=Pararhodospirillum photometricum TaxID=1084 RepID=UPI0002E550AF|nr:hypothetical protein [Pararhodospirillum photometricum]